VTEGYDFRLRIHNIPLQQRTHERNELDSVHGRGIKVFTSKMFTAYFCFQLAVYAYDVIMLGKLKYHKQKHETSVRGK